jgi:interferon-induced transmembrane protein
MEQNQTPNPGQPQYPPPQYPPPQHTPAVSRPPTYHQQAYGTPQHTPPPTAWGPPPAPSPNWPLSIIAAILAFPIGIVAVYFSAQVSQRLQAGDIAGAAKNSNLAKTWSIILIALGVFVFFITVAATP